MHFCLVSTRSVPEETSRLLLEACQARNILFIAIDAKTFDFETGRKLQAGDLLYNAAASVAAVRAEQFLFAPGVATFYLRPDGIFFQAGTPPLVAEFAGVPTPSTVYVASGDPDLLQRHVDRLGGFPVVVKVLGRSSGIGVMIAESMRALKSQIDFILAQGQFPLLSRFIADAVHWRIVMLGGTRVGSYRNKQVENDFRSAGSTDPADFETLPPAAAVEMAARATAAFGLEFAGVDILEDRAGGLWFLEANFPCYFPHAQLHGGMDIAGPMVDFLADKAVRLSKQYF